jgi:sugar phosphate isomerase/epimerase
VNEQQLKDAFSFSTCWNVSRHTDGRAMIEEIKSLGFTQVELNYEVPESMVKPIYSMVEKGEISISSLHNVFPFYPENDSDYGCNSLYLGFTDEVKRRRSIDLLLQTVDYAERLGASAIVVHPGEVAVPYNYDRVLTDLDKAGQFESEEYMKIWREMMDIRNRDSQSFVDTIIRSLEEVCERMAKKGQHIAIGLETRSRAYQIPTIEEVKYIMDKLKGAPIGLWYDIGHGMLMDKMRLYDAVKEVAEIKDRIVGLHIHESIGLSDHWCPYVVSKDDTYYDRFLEYIRDVPNKVFEIRGTPEQITTSFQMIRTKIMNMKG